MAKSYQEYDNISPLPSKPYRQSMQSPMHSRWLILSLGIVF